MDSLDLVEKAIFVEPVCLGMQHIPFNSAVINNYSKQSPNIELIFFGDPSYFQSLKDSLSDHAKIRIKLHQISHVGGRDDFPRLVKSFMLMSRLNSYAVRNKIKHVFFLTTTSGLLMAARFYPYQFFSFHFLHMLLARVETRFGMMSQPKYFGITAGLRLVKGNVKKLKLCVLESHIRDNVLDMSLAEKSSLCVIDHPTVIEEHVQQKYDHLVLDKSNIKLCFPGVFSEKKGSDDFIALAERKLTNLNLLINGKLADQDSVHYLESLDNLILSSIDKQLSRSKYLENIDQSDFLFIGHKEDVYRWCASGVYLDALARLKPIIARSSQFLKTQFRLYGAMGYLYDDVDDIVKFFESEQALEKYNDFIQALMNARNIRETQFSRQINHCLNLE
jgi:hypothetical protein